MRIAILMRLVSPWSRSVALHLCELGHSVHIIDFRESDGGRSYLRTDVQESEIQSVRSRVDGMYHLESARSFKLRYLLCARQLRAAFRRSGAEILLTLYGGGWAAMTWLSGVRPFAIYVVGSDVLLARGSGRWVSSRSLAAASTVFANGAYLAERTRTLAPGAVVVPLLLGVDTTRFVPLPAAPSPLRIVCTRGFNRIYNNEVIIRAVASVPEAITEAEVIFTSSGPGLPAARALADRIAPQSLRERMSFLGGVSADELLARLQGGHVFVSMSRSDGTATSLLEALACGLFPILSDIPANREWIEPSSNNGILVPPDDPDALASALKRALLDAGLRAHAAQVNRRRVMEEADSRNNTGLLARVLERVIESGGRT